MGPRGEGAAMTEVSATVEQAAQWVSDDSVPPADWNPIYRALVDDAGPAAGRTHGAGDTGAAELALVRRQLTTPALLVVAVTVGGRTHRLRIGLDPAAATIERGDGEQASRWTEIDVQEVPATIATLLEDSGIDLAPARLDIQRSGDALRLTPEQNRIARAALIRGLPAEAAFASVPELDDSLRDALTATGPRLTLALTLHDPRGRVTEQPVTWSRLWATGSRGLYRLDPPTGPVLEVHPVGGGDVLGTLLPILEQGLRFSAACTVSGGAR